MGGGRRRGPVALHAAGSVDRVPEEAVARHFHSHNPRVRRPAVHPNAHLHVLACHHPPQRLAKHVKLAPENCASRCCVGCCKFRHGMA
eukprot:2919186-Rhodomonas_salina.2